MAATDASTLFEGEIADTIHGFSCVYRFLPAQNASSDTPLIVLIPGGAHLARIFYGGHPGYRSKDFLVHWLNKAGFSVLAISYPLESNNAEFAVMPQVHPGFRTHEWGVQAAIIAAKVISTYGVNVRDILLSAWSMGGRIVVPFTRTARSLGLDVKLFVALAATPGLSRIRPCPPGIKRSACGLATFEGMETLFLRQIATQQELNGGRTIIPAEVYLRQYFGNTPVSLLDWNLRHDDEAAGFVEDHRTAPVDADVEDYSNLPWIATLCPTYMQDARHALCDKATWSALFTQKLTLEVEKAGIIGHIDHSRWTELLDFVTSVPNKLSKQVEGNHYFFLGERSAEQAARDIVRKWEESKTFQIKFEYLIRKSP
jgi:hypothetical protein